MPFYYDNLRFVHFLFNNKAITLILIVIVKILILLTITKVVYNLSIGEGDADFSAIWMNYKKGAGESKTLSSNFKNCHVINHS